MARRLILLFAALLTLLAGAPAHAPADPAAGAQNCARAFLSAAPTHARAIADQSSCKRPGSIARSARIASGCWVAAKGGTLAEDGAAALPGRAGVELGGRLSHDEQAALTEEHGVEFAQVYKAGSGPNGAGGKYYLYSGEARSVSVPVGPDIRLISHTHPGGTPFASGADMNLLDVLGRVGSPQRSSQIVLPGGRAFRFGGSHGRSGG